MSVRLGHILKIYKSDHADVVADNVFIMSLHVRGISGFHCNESCLHCYAFFFFGNCDMH